MNDITITCPSCSQELEVPQDLLGQVVECPACEQSIQLPDPAPQITQPGKKKVVIKKRTASAPRSRTRPSASRSMATPTSKSPQLSTGQGVAIVLGVIIVGVVGGLLSSSNSGSSSSRARPAPRPAPAPVKAWYSGGTLHAANMAAWRNASYANRLATSADFVTKMMQMDGETIPPVDQLKPRAYGLEKAISTAQREGIPDTMSVAEVAASCWVLMKQM